MPRILKPLGAIGVGVWVPLALIVVLISLPATSVTAQTIVVADEDFNNDIEAFGPGNGTSHLNQNGPPAGDSGIPGRWVPNGYSHTLISSDPAVSDQNPNLGTAHIAGIADKPFAPSPHAVKAAPTSIDYFGYPRSEGATSHSQGGILQFTDPNGVPIVANAGDTIVGEFQIWDEKSYTQPSGRRTHRHRQVSLVGRLPHGHRLRHTQYAWSIVPPRLCLRTRDA